MARGRGHKSYDSSRGASSRGEPTRGSSSRSRGSRARGGRGGGGGRGGYIGYNSSADTDFILQIYNNDDTGRYYSGPSTPQGRGRGRGRGFGSVYSPKGASGSPGKRRGQGRGRGGYDSRADPRGSNNSNVPLSISLRPLLRPVIFVPAQENKFLFQAEEELIQPIVEDAGMFHSSSKFQLFTSIYYQELKNRVMYLQQTGSRACSVVASNLWKLMSRTTTTQRAWRKSTFLTWADSNN
ncbi:hypothetical protein J3R30DRAFT_2371377 [Lentinula aciculospora]|uniref:Uncharacterized protein n=1 Tax=Lentinula aciculospora TaxID=153920 RepID=A0A9W9AFM7_9AGAR|nr:hypothetical protein J3R30DRAFT_2371377 [Lentinula aciculospora]